MVPLSVQRLARNQVIFREVNERLRELAEAVPDGTAEYLCECGNLGCAERLELELHQYESVRARPRCFFVLPGHERPEVERVVDQSEGFVIVEKLVPLDEAAGRALTSTDDVWSSRGA